MDSEDFGERSFIFSQWDWVLVSQGTRRQCGWTGTREGGEVAAGETGVVAVSTEQTVRLEN